MNKERSAVWVAKKFLDAADELERAMIKEDGNDWRWPLTGRPTTGAVKRASMDLTRSLAIMRKSG